MSVSPVIASDALWLLPTLNARGHMMAMFALQPATTAVFDNAEHCLRGLGFATLTRADWSKNRWPRADTAAIELAGQLVTKLSGPEFAGLYPANPLRTDQLWRAAARLRPVLAALVPPGTIDQDMPTGMLIPVLRNAARNRLLIGATVSARFHTPIPGDLAA